MHCATTVSFILHLTIMSERETKIDAQIKFHFNDGLTQAEIMLSFHSAYNNLVKRTVRPELLRELVGKVSKLK